jgi:hypothetical protein
MIVFRNPKKNIRPLYLADTHEYQLYDARKVPAEVLYESNEDGPKIYRAIKKEHYKSTKERGVA